MTIFTGLGFQDVKLDISAALNSLGQTVTAVVAMVEDPDEGKIGYASAPPAAASMQANGAPTIFTSDITNAVGEVEVRTFLGFRHEFAQRGTHRISVRFEFANGEYVTAPSAILIGAGDGLNGGSFQ